MEILETGKDPQKFGWLELLIIALVIAIIGVLAVPQMSSSRRAASLSKPQKQIVYALREARKEAMLQKKPITFYYDDTNKNIIIGGGNFGAVGDIENKVISIIGGGLSRQDIIYGQSSNGAIATLTDGSKPATLTDNKFEVIFQSDGSAADENENVRDLALFFYNPKSPDESAFAISILGAGGRVKVWQYNKQEKSFVE